MLRRDFLIGAAAGLAAFPAYAGSLRLFGPDLWPPMANRAEFVAWMVANRGEDPTILGQRYDRYQQCSLSTISGPPSRSAPTC